MAEYQCVHSSHAISIRITDMLENMRGQSFGGANRTETVRDINDILQGRGGRSIESFLTELRNMGGFAYISEVDEIIRDVQAYLAQKTLLFQPYTKAGSNRQYRYSNYGLDQARPSKALKQWQYDRAVKQGFPPGFFRDRIFEGVNVYCLPDLADLSNSRFNSCNFSVCRVVDANFENTVFTSSSFDACYIKNANFSGATLVHTHFRDCTMNRITFEGARLGKGNVIDCVMDDIDFLNATLDGAFFGRVTPGNIKNLNRSTITEGGATAEEVKRLRASIFKALRVPDLSIVPQHKQSHRKPHRAGPER